MKFTKQDGHVGEHKDIKNKYQILNIWIYINVLIIKYPYIGYVLRNEMRLLKIQCS